MFSQSAAPGIIWSTRPKEAMYVRLFLFSFSRFVFFPLNLLLFSASSRATFTCSSVNPICLSAAGFFSVRVYLQSVMRHCRFFGSKEVRIPVLVFRCFHLLIKYKHGCRTWDLNSFECASGSRSLRKLHQREASARFLFPRSAQIQALAERRQLDRSRMSNWGTLTRLCRVLKERGDWPFFFF